MTPPPAETVLGEPVTPVPPPPVVPPPAQAAPAQGAPAEPPPVAQVEPEPEPEPEPEAEPDAPVAPPPLALRVLVDWESREVLVGLGEHSPPIKLVPDAEGWHIVPPD